MNAGSMYEESAMVQTRYSTLEEDKRTESARYFQFSDEQDTENICLNNLMVCKSEVFFLIVIFL